MGVRCVAGGVRQGACNELCRCTNTAATGSATVTLTLPPGPYPDGYDKINPATGLPEPFL
jgi:hypothetical protein